MKSFFDSLKYKVCQYEEKYEDHPNKAAAHMLLWSVRALIKSWPKFMTHKLDSTGNIKILFKMEGGIGDILIALNYLKNLYRNFKSNVVMDLVVSDKHIDSVKSILYKQKFIHNIFTDRIKETGYNIVFRFCRFPIIEQIGFNVTKTTDNFLKIWINSLLNFQHTYPEYTEYKTRFTRLSDRLLEQYSLLQNRNRLSEADVCNLLNVETLLKIILKKDQYRILKKYNLCKYKYITIQRGVGIDSVGEARDLPVDKYNELTKELHKKYPVYKLVQVGYDNCEKISNIDIDLRGKTDFDDLLCILKFSKLHVDSEAGCVHFRHFLCAKPSVVLFGPTNKDFYGYSENINISSNKCAGCEWLNNKWRNVCSKTNRCDFLCMKEINIKTIIDNNMVKKGLRKI